MSKFVNLEQIKVLANKVKSEDAALGTKLETVTTKVDNLVAAGGEANILEGVKVNGAALAISDKMVDILIASGEENGTISVNGAAVAIKGLAALAYKSEITEDELGEALKASIAAKATKADLDALTVRVGKPQPTCSSEISCNTGGTGFNRQAYGAGWHNEYGGVSSQNGNRRICG